MRQRHTSARHHYLRARDRGHHFRSVPDCPSRAAAQLTKGPARLSSRPRLSSRRRCDLPPFHALAARRTLAGCMRHKAAVRTKTTSRTKGIARHTPKMTSSHPGMTAIRLRTTLRTTITGWYSPTRYLTVSLRWRLRSAHRSSHRGGLGRWGCSRPGRKTARGAPHTRPRPPSARMIRGAAEAGPGHHRNPGTDYRRNWGRSAHTRRYSRLPSGRRRYGPGAAARTPSCRAQAGRAAGTSGRPERRYAARRRWDYAGAVKGPRRYRQPTGYRCPRSGDCSFCSPPVI